jgi:Zn-dependent protease
MTSETTNQAGTAFTRFMASGYGRLARVAFGMMLVAVGLAVVPRPIGLAVATFGVVPIAAGVFNLCPVAPLWGGQFFGARYCPSKQAVRSE